METTMALYDFEFYPRGGLMLSRFDATAGLLLPKPGDEKYLFAAAPMRPTSARESTTESGIIIPSHSDAITLTGPFDNEDTRHEFVQTPQLELESVISRLRSFASQCGGPGNMGILINDLSAYEDDVNTVRRAVSALNAENNASGDSDDGEQPKFGLYL